MRKIRWFSALAGLVTLALASCGGSGCDTSFAGTCGTGSTSSAVASVLLVSDTSSIPSDNSISAKFTAYVRDANNNFVNNVPVVFTASSGGINVTQGLTDANGVATATVSTLADKSNRTITVTATADKIVATATVDVAGTSIKISGPAALTSGQQGSYTATLNDAGGHGIPGIPVTVQLPSVLTGTVTGLMTDSQGRVTFTATGSTGGTGLISATALGLLPDTLSVSVNGSAITFTAPVAATPGSAPTIPLNTSTTFTINYVINGMPQANALVNLATTRGCFSAGTTCAGQPTTAVVTTDGSGNASVQVVSDNAGGANVSAASGGSTGQITVQFISSLAATIDVQPTLFTLAPNVPPKTDQQSTITAIVRDANNNLVTGVDVSFTVNDVTGGTLTIGSAKTDLQGRAQTVYIAGTTTSAANGVVITATVTGKPISKSVNLTVARKQVFISMGTGNAIVANQAKTQYQKDYVVQVTDANGAGVANVTLSMSVLSNYYFKGYRVPGTTTWANCYTVPIDQCDSATNPNGAGAVLLPTIPDWGCADEDVNRNGILDVGPPPYTEDNNGNGKLDAGNIALVSPSSVVTDPNGFANVSVFYPEEYAYWLQVTLQAQTSVQGTAFAQQSVFVLPGLKDDFVVAASPPGPVSPFGYGVNHTCTDAL
jgi:hypothetical protein